MVISEQHYRAIGRISVMFSDVEIWTSAIIWQLIGPDQSVGQMVTAGMSFPRQLDLLASLFRHRFPDPSLTKALGALIKRISELEQKRNAVLHSSWILQTSERNEAIRFKITAKREKRSPSHQADYNARRTRCNCRGLSKGARGVYQLHSSSSFELRQRTNRLTKRNSARCGLQGSADFC